MNAPILLKGLILVALSHKFVRSDDAGAAGTPNNSNSYAGIDAGISTIYESALPDFEIEKKIEADPSDDDFDINISDSRDSSKVIPAARVIPAASATPKAPSGRTTTPARVVPAKPKKEEEDIFDRNIGSFPDGWHTYQGGNELRGAEAPAKRREDDGSIPIKADEKKEKKETKTKAGVKKVKRDSSMPVGAIAVMVTSGCVLVVAVAVAATVRK
nr:hypothetical protein MACL_00003044 [Theileria orientalis]